MLPEDHVFAMMRQILLNLMLAAHSLELATHAQRVLLEADLIQLNVYAHLVKHMMLPEDLVNAMMRLDSLNLMQAIHLLELATHVLMVPLEVCLM